MSGHYHVQEAVVRGRVGWSSGPDLGESLHVSGSVSLLRNRGGGEEEFLFPPTKGHG